MNKVFVFALLALVAACAAAPQGFSPAAATSDSLWDSVKKIDGEPGVDLAAHEQIKRAILYPAPIGSPYYPAGRLANFAYRYAPYSTYPSAYSYYPYGDYAI